MLIDKELVLMTFLRSIVGENSQPSEMSLYVFSDFIDWTIGIYFFDLVLLIVEIDNWLGLIIENLQSLVNRFCIII